MLRATEHGPITWIRLARTFCSRPLYTTGVYKIGSLLIDTGCSATAVELVSWCRGRDIRQAVNTHHHEDHAGGDSALRGVLGVPVSAPAVAVPILAEAPRLQFYRRVVWGQPGRVAVRALGEVVESGRYRFEVISTPGHCPDHVCLFEREHGWLFGGDLFIHERVRYLRRDEDALATLDSLRRVLALRPTLLLCAHGGPLEDAVGAIARKIAYWEGLADRARALREEGFSLREISDRLLGPEGVMTWASRGHFAKRNLIRSLLGEVEWPSG